MIELDARVSGNTLVVLEYESKSSRVRLVNDDEELVATADCGMDALDLFKHPFAMIDRFKTIKKEFDPENYIYDAEKGELIPR